MTPDDVQYRCSFCEKDQHAVKRLIAGPRGVFICDECLALARQILSGDAPEPADRP